MRHCLNSTSWNTDNNLTSILKVRKLIGLRVYVIYPKPHSGRVEMRKWVCWSGSREKSSPRYFVPANFRLFQPFQQVPSKGYPASFFPVAFRDHCKTQKVWEYALEFISWKVTMYVSYLGAVRSYQRRRRAVLFCFLWLKAHVLETLSFLAPACACELGMTKTVLLQR